MNYRGRRATVMGLGHFGGGVAAAQWLARQGALVTVTDLAGEAVLGDSLRELAADPIAAYRLGGHAEEDFRAADLVVVNPAVKPGNGFLEIARQAGAELVTEIELFLRHFPGRAIGVTGSNGKSTTAAMGAAILQAGARRVWLGGNLGGSLLGRLGEMTADDWAVLEISSFQLFHSSAAARMPEVAVVTHCTPNHLDWHGSLAEYAAAKQRILGRVRACTHAKMTSSPANHVRRGSPTPPTRPTDGLPSGCGMDSNDRAFEHAPYGNGARACEHAPYAVVLNMADPEVAGWAGLAASRLLPLIGDAELPDLPVPGEHNRMNARLAATAALGAGCPREAIARGLAAFRPLPGRLEMVAACGGRRFYNDTTATTPESTIAALRSLDGPVWLLAGGGDKGSNFGPMAAEIAARARGAAFYGRVRERLRDEVLRRDGQFACVAVETLDDALGWCRDQSRPGDSIVLSPGCSSHDQFRNFAERGRRFVELVGQVAGAGGVGSTMYKVRSTERT